MFKKRKKYRIRSSLLKPNKRIHIENRGTTMNVSNKIRTSGITGYIPLKNYKVLPSRNRKDSFFYVL